MDDLAGRDGALDGVEEADELLMAMLLHAAPDHGSVEHVERGEQRRRAVAFVVVGHGPAFAGLERQAGLRAVERLDLAFLVDRDDDGVRGRVHVEADDVLDLLGEIGIVGALEGAEAMRLQPMRLPQALDGAQAMMPTALAMARPVQWVASPGGSEQVSSSTFATTLAESGALPGLRVLSRSKAVDALLAVAQLPAPDRGAADPGATRDFQNRQALGGQQNDLRPLNMLERAAAVRDDGEQTLAIFGRNNDIDGLGHVARLAYPAAPVNPMSASVH